MYNKGKYQKLGSLSDESSSDNEINYNVKDEASLLTENIKLKQNVGIIDGISIVVGSMIGSGIFIVPTGVLQHCNGDMSLSMIIWVLGGIIAFAIALCFCELATLIPESGGMAPFLKAIYGNGMCFVFLWIFLLTACPQGAAVQIIALGDYISQAIAVGLDICKEDLSPTLSKMIGFSVTMLILACNMINVKMAVKLQFWCTAGKVAALVIISVAGLIMVFMDTTTLVNNFQYSLTSANSLNSNLSQSSIKDVLIASAHAAPGLSGLSLAVFQALWAYDGFDNITCITEEVKNPKRTLPMIIILSIVSVVSLYLIVNVSYFAVLTQQEMLDSDAVAVSFAAKVHPWLAYVVTAGVCLSLIGSINITFLAAGRMPFVAGRMGFMPEILSMVHIKYMSPVPALLFLTFLISIMVLPSNIDILLKAVVFTLWAYRGLCTVGVLILRRKMKNIYRPYKVYKGTVIFASLLCVYIVSVPLLFNPQPLFALTFVLIVICFIVYFLIKKKYFTMTGIGKWSISMQFLLQVASTNDSSKSE